MKRLLIILLLASPAFGHDWKLYHPNLPVPKIIELDPPQTNTFCASNLTCTVTAPWTYSGNLTVSGTALTCTLNGAPVLNPTCFSGADIIAQMVTAAAALPSFGGTIWIPAPTGGGCWTATTSGVFNTGSKLISFRGLASANQIGTAGVCINFTPTTAVTAITIDFTNSTGSQSPLLLFQDIALINNGCVTAGGCGSSATGIAFGNTNAGCPKCVIDRVMINGFGTGINNPNNSSWGQAITNSHFAYNTVGLNYANAENTTIRDTKFVVNGTGITSATGELTIQGGSLDSSSTVGFTCTGAAGTQTSYLTDVHMENLGQSNTHMVSGTCNINIKGGVLENDNVGGTSDWMISGTGAALTIRDLVVASQSTQTLTVGYVQCTTPVRCDISMTDVTASKGITGVGGTALASAHIKVVNGGTNNNPAREEQGDTLYDCNSTNGGFGIGDAFFTRNAATCLHVRASGNTFDHFRSEDSANTHTMDFGSGVCGATFFTFEDITNTVCALEYQFTTKKWTIPATVTGGLTLGSPLNFTSVLVSPTAPTIAAAGCGGAAAAITAPNGTGSFEVSVGTTPGSACTITMPAATTSWTCDANTVSATTTTNFYVKQTGALSTTSVVLTLFSDVAAATAFQGSDTLRVKCSAN